MLVEHNVQLSRYVGTSHVHHLRHGGQQPLNFRIGHLSALWLLGSEANKFQLIIKLMVMVAHKGNCGEQFLSNAGQEFPNKLADGSKGAWVQALLNTHTYRGWQLCRKCEACCQLPGHHLE